MEIRYFKEFLILADTMNYWEASRRLFIGQSTLSKHIHAMEKELGVPLFFRTSRKVELTPYGELLIPYARSISENMDGCVNALTEKQKNINNTLNIGTIPSSDQHAFTKYIVDFRSQNPSLKVNILEGDSMELGQWLLCRKCELAFIREYPSFPQETCLEQIPLHKITLSSDHLVAILPAQHPLAGRRELSLRELSGENFCLLKEGTLIWQVCLQACQNAGFAPRIVLDSHHFPGIKNMILTGGCVSLLTSGHACSADFSNDSRLSIVKIVPEITSTISLCYMQNETLSAGARLFLRDFSRKTQS